MLSLLSYAPFAHAGLFTDIWRFMAGVETEAKVESSAAAISLPLLGSRSTTQVLGMGGPSESEGSALSTVQDSALVASRNPAGTLPVSHNNQILIYTVQDRDTPGGIAEKHGITLNTLLWANNIRNPNLIKVGDEMVILPVPGVQVKVEKGWTIASIAQKFKGDENEIRIINGLGIDEQVKPGMMLIISDGEMALPSAPLSGQPPRIAALPPAPVGYYMRPIIGGRNSRATKNNPQGIHGYNGVDLASYCGAPILASAKGKVIIVRASGWNSGWGRYMVISTPRGTQLYAHVDKILAVVGQEVEQASQIATIGSTGNSTGCHVHFEIRGDPMIPGI